MGADLYGYQCQGLYGRNVKFYGVHSVTLYVDSVKVFNSTTDEVSADENRMINGFTDYDELMRTRRLIMRSYKLPGNRLRLIETGSDRGLVTIDEERDYHFCYVLEDNFGNKRKYRFTVRGKNRRFLLMYPKPIRCCTGIRQMLFRSLVWNWLYLRACFTMMLNCGRE